MYLADTLSRAYLPHDKSSMAQQELEHVNMIDHIDLEKTVIARIKQLTEQDTQLQQLQDLIEKGWPTDKNHDSTTSDNFFSSAG
jgi:hypothetical protein